MRKKYYDIINKKAANICEARIEEQEINNLAIQLKDYEIQDLFTLCMLYTKKYDISRVEKIYTQDKVVIYLSLAEYKNKVVSDFFELLDKKNHNALDDKMIEYVDKFKSKYRDIREIEPDDVFDYHQYYFETYVNYQRDKVLNKDVCYTIDKMYSISIEDNTYYVYFDGTNDYTIDTLIATLYADKYKIKEEKSRDELADVYKEFITLACDSLFLNLEDSPVEVKYNSINNFRIECFDNEGTLEYKLVADWDKLTTNLMTIYDANEVVLFLKYLDVINEKIEEYRRYR